MLLTQDVNTARVLNAVAAGQTPQTSTAVDSIGFDAVTFYALFGAITAGGTVTVTAEHSDAHDSGFEPLAGASVSFDGDDDNHVAVIEVSQPRKRYLRAAITRADEDAAIDGVLAMLHSAQVRPVGHADGVEAVLVLAPDQAA